MQLRFSKQREMVILLRIDKAILDTSEVICDNIARFGSTERGLLSQNILGHIRNFVEYVAIKAFSNGADVNPNAPPYLQIPLSPLQSSLGLRSVGQPQPQSQHFRPQS